jgi:hypothetical protein
MSQYLVAIHLPDNFNPSAADEAAMGRDIDTLNEEMVAAGVRKLPSHALARHFNFRNGSQR